MGRGPVPPERAVRPLPRGGRRGSSPRGRPTAPSRRPRSSRPRGRPPRPPGETFRYSGAGREIPKEESDRRAAAGEPFVVRLKMPDEPIVVDDLVQGRVEFPAELARRLRPRALRRPPALPLLRLRRRRGDGDHARRARRRPPREHAEARRALPRARRRGAEVRAPRDDPRHRRQEALEAARRGRRRGVPRPGAPPRGARQLPRAPRLVAGRGPRADDDGRDGRALLARADRALAVALRPREARLAERPVPPGRRRAAAPRAPPPLRPSRGVPGRDAPPGPPAPEAAREDARRARAGPRDLRGGPGRRTTRRA